MLLADDNRYVRNILREILEVSGEVEVVGEAADGAELLEKAGTPGTDVYLVDIQMPVMDGIEAIGCLKARNPGCRVLVLSMYSDSALVERALSAGANGYLLKANAAAELLPAIKKVCGGGSYLDATLRPKGQQ